MYTFSEKAETVSLCFFSAKVYMSLLLCSKACKNYTKERNENYDIIY